MGQRTCLFCDWENRFKSEIGTSNGDTVNKEAAAADSSDVQLTDQVVGVGRYFYDTEFHWDAGGIRLISIAVVSDDGREFYAHADQYDAAAASSDPFLAKSVLPAVFGMPRRSAQSLRTDLDEFFNPRPRQLWADFGAWDQVALMQIWGGMGAQPSWLPMQTRDVRLFAALLGRELPDYPPGQHDALVDAKHVQVMFNSIERDLERAVQIIRGR